MSQHFEFVSEMTSVRAAKTVSKLNNGNRKRGSQSFANMVTNQVEKCANMVRLDLNVREVVSKPRSEVKLNFPIKLSDGTLKMFNG